MAAVLSQTGLIQGHIANNGPLSVQDYPDPVLEPAWPVEIHELLKDMGSTD